MRLSTINEDLVQRFRQAVDTNDTRRLFEEIFRLCACRIEGHWFALLGNEQLALQLTAGELPQGFDFNALAAAMDETYFNAEDERLDEGSVANFPLARLMSTLSLAAAATDAHAFSEATYEAIMTLPNP